MLGSLKALQEKALSLCSTIPYHNSDHALAVLDQALALSKKAVAAGLVVDELVVAVAALFHDAGYAQAPEDSREVFAAHLAQQCLQSFGWQTERIAAVCDCILATVHDSAPTTVEQEIVRAADLSQMAADFATFEHNAELLRQECAIFHKDLPERSAWKQQVGAIVKSYVSKETSRPTFFPAYMVAWKLKAEANIQRYTQS